MHGGAVSNGTGHPRWPLEAYGDPLSGVVTIYGYMRYDGQWIGTQRRTGASCSGERLSVVVAQLFWRAYALTAR